MFCQNTKFEIFGEPDKIDIRDLRVGMRLRSILSGEITGTTVLDIRKKVTRIGSNTEDTFGLRPILLQEGALSGSSRYKSMLLISQQHGVFVLDRDTKGRGLFELHKAIDLVGRDGISLLSDLDLITYYTVRFSNDAPVIANGFIVQGGCFK